MTGFVYLDVVGGKTSENVGEKGERVGKKKKSGRATKAFKATCEKSAVLQQLACHFYLPLQMVEAVVFQAVPAGIDCRLASWLG